jgi:hypothetical protein
MWAPHEQRRREVEKPKQVSVASLPEKQQDGVMAACDDASERYPAAVLPTGERLHVYEQAGEWHVWLNCEDADFTGICVAVAPTRDEAIARAVAVFEAAADQLQQPVLT